MMDSKRVVEAQERPEFEQRHVLTLKKVYEWGQDDITLHKKHNRVLQPGYSHLTPDEIIHIARVTRTPWLTDIICPKAIYACKLNIAAELITRFKVDGDMLNALTQKVFNSLLKKHDPLLLAKAESDIQLVMQSPVVMENIMEAARLNMLQTFEVMNDQLMQDFLNLEIQKYSKFVTHRVMQDLLEPFYPAIAHEFDLEYKTLHVHSDNGDYSILGAAGSGKSSIAKLFLTN